ncbi:MAG: hypothetical protein ACLTDR_11570 [Adlercreutzia equolifaciens]
MPPLRGRAGAHHRPHRRQVPRGAHLRRLGAVPLRGRAGRARGVEAEQERAARGAAEAARLAKLDASGIPERYRCAEHPWAARLAERIAGGQGFYLRPERHRQDHAGLRRRPHLPDRGMSVRFAVSTSLLESLREFGKDARSLADDLAGCDLLVIDDLGKEGSGHSQAAERLFDLVNDRYNRSTLLHPRPTLVTSNFRRGELPA